ncbi:hypothetical protein RJ639_005334 [Escallonia herrerae]|uniref:Receptor-like serine/threonine-protein kinase n=1 Tax=Escallonia herrerae TaxID=1293975 RepID=A0AA88W0M1_9ASTE|nr:hypothetical protein RJ639_005334 [Escallonia herrerae]
MPKRFQTILFDFTYLFHLLSPIRDFALSKEKREGHGWPEGSGGCSAAVVAPLFHIPSLLGALLTRLPSVNRSTSWKNNGNNLQGHWNFGDGSGVRPILYVTDAVNPPFAFGFFGNGTAVDKSFYLSVFSLSTFPYSFTNSNLNTSSSGNATIASSPASTNRSTGFYINLNCGPIVVWSANRDRPVGENATLDFTPEGNLELKDADGTFVWSTNTSSLSVLCLNLTTGGNLILVDGKDSVIWQSVDYPTDTWLPNQNIPVGKKLVASNFSSNLAPGMYYLSVTSHGIYAFITSEFDPPKVYSTLLSGSDMFHSALGINGRIESNANYARFNLVNILEAGFHYIKLEINGHLNVYRLNKFDEYGYDVIFSGDLLKDFDYGDCTYPRVCGDYGVCSMNQCTCPAGNAGYFRLLYDSQNAFGCRRVTPLSCKDMRFHTFLELENLYSLRAYKFRYSESAERYNSIVFLKVQKSPDRKKLLLILVPSLSVGLAIVVFVAISFYYHKVHKNSNYVHIEDDDSDQVRAVKRFSFLELRSATRDFQVKLGRGGFGSVFEGDLADGTKVAVKRLDSTGQGKKEFMAEVNTIGNIHHFNLVRLVGYCADKSNRLLVYEHMCNGSLDKWIFNPDRERTLTWEMRRKIIIGIAKGLEYLHMHCDPNIIHFDIKPQNILLNGDFDVKISDFGLAKLIDRDQSQVLTVLKGTPGYVAPELYTGINISVKADIFSFGIVILEIVFGRKNLGSSQFEPLIELVKEKAEKDLLHDLFAGSSEDFLWHLEEAMKMIKIAILCLQVHSRRPSISSMVKVLEGSMDLESIAEYCFLSMPEIATHIQANSAASANSTPPAESSLSGPR